MLRADKEMYSLWDQRHWSRIWRHWLDHSSVFLPSSLCFPAAQLSLALSCDTAGGGSGCSCVEDVINHMLSRRLPVVENEAN